MFTNRQRVHEMTCYLYHRYDLIRAAKAINIMSHQNRIVPTTGVSVCITMIPTVGIFRGASCTEI
jgi:hypothetical protein